MSTPAEDLPPNPAKNPTPQPDVQDPRIASSIDRYWRKNVAIMAVLLTIWAAAGLGCGILFADWLNQWNLPGTGFPLGFWFAQQGSIIVFVLVILAYALLLNRLDKVHRDELRELRENAEGGK